jgi:hypothetical protein
MDSIWDNMVHNAMYEKHMRQYVGHIQDYVWVVYRKTYEHFIYNNILVIYGLYIGIIWQYMEY